MRISIVNLVYLVAWMHTLKKKKEEPSWAVATLVLGNDLPIILAQSDVLHSNDIIP